MSYLSYWLFLVLTAGCSIFAIVKGDAALRSGGILLIALTVLGSGIDVLAESLNFYPDTVCALVDVASTLVIALGYLYLGYRHGSIWLAPAMTIQGAELYIASQSLNEYANTTSLFAWDNVISCGVAVALLAGTLASARERKAKTASPAALSPLAEPDADLAEPGGTQDAVFVFHLPHDDSNRLLTLAAEAKVLPSQYVRDLVSTFIEGDHFAPRRDEKAYPAAL